ncbi:FadR family transcriptional regulator [Rhizobiaceae bacterium CRRU44]|uniref:FadR family transcriptional regulator n=1 Tax=Ferranicluibacter rubi TaxID=2715133 RepID=A0AA43ZGK4_9HYPH|nr:FadR/GntR family transcriptional regulator [Ferranicluibacter rubi]NHT77500.1 FadR family transcriptional regulator [Ferranicluibacter rubi]
MKKGPLETLITGVDTRTSHSQVVDVLGRAIISGEFPVGTILPGDQELAMRFKVSRTVLREAMKTLAAKGLIVPRARIGTRVTARNQWNLFDSDILTWHFHNGIDEDFLTHISEVRMAFEPHAAALAAIHATEVEISHMMRLAVAMGDPAHTPESLAVADLRFHLAVAEASANPFMRSVGSLIEAALVGIFKLSSPAADREGIEDVSRNHIRIVEQISRRDEAGARAAMEVVIRVGRARVRVAMDDTPETVAG